MISFPPADIAAHIGAPRVLDTDQHRLVEHCQAVFIHRHIGRSDHGDNTLGRFRGGDIERDQSSMRLVRKDHYGVERVGWHSIGWIRGASGDLRRRVVANR